MFSKTPPLRPILLAAALWTGCVGTSLEDDSALPLHDPLADGLQFGMPFAEPLRISALIGVDHDAEVHDGVAGSAICRNHDDQPFPACYDEHRGSDFILDGGFDSMDAGSVAVIAAASGVVTEMREDQYDRCHTADFEVTCDGHPVVPNLVRLLHPDGRSTSYYHLMKDSVGIEVGDEVSCGQPLGLVGSSGRSSMPHLHFQVENADGTVIDPFAGPLSQPESLWIDQMADFDLPALGCDSGPP